MPRIHEEKLPYKIVLYPGSKLESREGVAQVLNLQPCTCGHDRAVHTDYLGDGPTRKVIIDCPRAGKCALERCKCSHFVFDTQAAGSEAKKRRLQEKKQNKIIPPEK